MNQPDYTPRQAEAAITDAPAYDEFADARAAAEARRTCHDVIFSHTDGRYHLINTATITHRLPIEYHNDIAYTTATDEMPGGKPIEPEEEEQPATA